MTRPAPCQSDGDGVTRDLTFACTCGAVTGTLRRITPRSGGQLRCHCRDCRGAQIWLGQPDPDPDGVCYYQTTPDRIVLATGQDRLGALKWKKGRLVRWYATCCGAPLVNTLDSAKWPFASLDAARLTDPDALTDTIGPCRAYAFRPAPDGKTTTKGMFGFILGFLGRTASARLSGRWRETPFFDGDGHPAAEVRQLTEDDRAIAHRPPSSDP